jgi:glycosyltransferase involved in cell wall biosynthesis
MGWLLRTFDHIVFSTRFQEEIYEKHYRKLPPHSVIENAVPEGSPRRSRRMSPGQPLRLLYLGRLVGFKNIPNLLRALKAIHEPPLRRSMTLTIVGDGPLLDTLKLQAPSSKLQAHFLPPAHGAEVHRIFAEHDLLVLPSLTEISPNVALEARAYGLPVLLTKETGLSASFAKGMLLRELKTKEQIQSALLEVLTRYDLLAAEAAKPLPERGWGRVVGEYLQLFAAL